MKRRIVTDAAAFIKKAFQYEFQDNALLQEALTHPSLDGKRNYQRLEFLGDRVLGLSVARKLYQEHPDVKEGILNRTLSGLVRKESLADVAVSIGLGEVILMAHALDESGGRKQPGVLADVMEAIIGAIFLEAGFDVADSAVQRLWKVLDKNTRAQKDSKSALQEWAQARGMDLPEYQIKTRSGPDHAPHFVIEVILENGESDIGEGRSKRRAEVAAAKNLLARLKKGDA